MTTAIQLFNRNFLGLLLIAAVACFALGAPLVQAEDSSADLAAIETVSINNDGEDALADILVGVGPSKAKAIVEYRDENGAFTAIEQLMEVKGIGEKTFEKNRHRITL